MSNNVVIDFYEIKHNKDLLDNLIRQIKSQKHYSTQNPEIAKNIKNFNQAKEEIKRKIIESDKSVDNSLAYTAITSFKNTNE